GGSCDSRPTRSPAPLRRRPWSPCCCNDCDGIRASSRFGGESTPAISIRSGSTSASPTCGPILTCCGSPRSLCALAVILCVVACVPLRFCPYVPYYVVVQNLVMKPLRIIALVLELTLQSLRRDNYIPRHQRWKLS